MKCAEPANFHRKSGMWGTRVTFGGGEICGFLFGFAQFWASRTGSQALSLQLRLLGRQVAGDGYHVFDGQLRDNALHHGRHGAVPGSVLKIDDLPRHLAG
jgi:hypothetical protein